MRVRISFDALRLCLLVAAGVTSGYLWRAAFESSSPEVRVAGKPRIVEQAPAPPVVRIPPARLTPRAQRVHRHAVRRNAVRRVQPARAAFASRQAAPAPTPAQPKPAPAPRPASPPPTPAPTPVPAPTTSTPQPQTQTAGPVQAAVAVPASPPASPPETPTVSNADGTRPGWGKGDKNHDHTGPGSDTP